MIIRRNLKEGVEVEEVEEIKEEPVQKSKKVKLEISNARQILFKFSFRNYLDVPKNLRSEEANSDDYIKNRAKEVLEAGINPEDIEVQRPTRAVPDTGFIMERLTHCEGGETIFWQLLKKGWKVIDSHWKVQESQESIELGKGDKKYQVFISLSQEGEEAELDDITCKGILRLMRMTWAVSAWDNRELSQNNIVLNFPLCRGKKPAKQVFVLKQT